MASVLQDLWGQGGIWGADGTVFSAAPIGAVKPGPGGPLSTALLLIKHAGIAWLHSSHISFPVISHRNRTGLSGEAAGPSFPGRWEDVEAGQGQTLDTAIAVDGLCGLGCRTLTGLAPGVSGALKGIS